MEINNSHLFKKKTLEAGSQVAEAGTKLFMHSRVAYELLILLSPPPECGTTRLALCDAGDITEGLYAC